MTDMNKINFEALEDLANLAVIFLAAGFEVNMFGSEMLASMSNLTVVCHRKMFHSKGKTFECYAVDLPKEKVEEIRVQRVMHYKTGTYSACEEDMREHVSMELPIWGHSMKYEDIEAFLRKAEMLQ